MQILIVAFAAMAAVFDLKTRRIPNMLIIAMLAGWLAMFMHGIVTDTSAAFPALIDSIIGFAIGGGIFVTVYLASHKGLGGGDVKFMAAAGLYLGIASTLPAILYGTTLAALTGLVLIALKKITRKDKLPLAPFLLAGITIAVLFQ